MIINNGRTSPVKISTMKTKKTSKKAISPLLATIILIAITVVGGLVVYSVFSSSAATAGSKPLVTITSTQLVVTSGGTTTFSLTMKNDGSKPVTGITYTLQGCTGACTVPALQFNGAAVSATNPLGPGQTAAASGSPTATYTIGNSYSVTVTATFSDGSTFNYLSSVSASSA